jgi:2-polyprenyl-3-methyl-5-hydroxy-6-metoxy-1,4-benzoquinol methylase
MNSGKEQYFQHVRTELIEEIPIGNHRILEVGCAEGSTCAALKSKGCATVVVGIELDPVAATSAEQKLDHVVCGDIETLTLHKPWFAEESFDYIICGDVLEHLKDPWGQLDRILKLLAPGGKLIISLPNIRYYGVTFPLIFRDEWTYTDSGILDSTHYRFFTKSTSIQMLLSAGLVNISYNSIIHKRRDRLLNLVSFGLLTGLVTPQWVLTGTKTPK